VSRCGGFDLGGEEGKEREGKEDKPSRTVIVNIIYIYVYIKQLLHTRARARNTKQ